jgi:hypothetical protein
MSADDWNFFDLMATILVGTFIAYVVEGRAVLPLVREDPLRPRASKVLAGLFYSIPYTTGGALVIVAAQSYHNELPPWARAAVFCLTMYSVMMLMVGLASRNYENKQAAEFAAEFPNGLPSGSAVVGLQRTTPPLASDPTTTRVPE